MCYRFNSFTHMWSLGVEEQFYLIFPMLILLAYGHRAVATAAPVRSCWRGPLVVLGGLSLASFGGCWPLSWMHFDYAFYFMPARLWQLACGALLFDWQAAGEGVTRLNNAAVLLLLDALSIGLVGVGFWFSSPRRQKLIRVNIVDRCDLFIGRKKSKDILSACSLVQNGNDGTARV